MIPVLAASSPEVSKNTLVLNAIGALATCGFVHICEPLPTTEEAHRLAGSVVEARAFESGLKPLKVIGDFVVPPSDDVETRDFQTLHFDFGMPLVPKVEQEVAIFTALYCPVDVADVQAVTRLVPLTPLLGQRTWPPSRELVERLSRYGKTHGAWDDDQGYVEGSLARIIDAAVSGDESPPLLPSVKTHPDFLCGLEFDSLSAELEFFECHGLRIPDVQIDIALGPGELLVFDNLAMAHGRRGTRKPGELRQWVFGLKLQPDALARLRDRILAAFCERVISIP